MGVGYLLRVSLINSLLNTGMLAPRLTRYLHPATGNQSDEEPTFCNTLLGNSQQITHPYYAEFLFVFAVVVTGA